MRRVVIGLVVGGGIAGWFFVAVAVPRLTNQDAMVGLAAPVGIDWNDTAQLDSLLVALATAFADRPKNAGIAIGVTLGGQHHVAYRGVMAIRDSGALVGDSTLFEVGSLTKTFTGISLAQAVLTGRAALDQPIGSLLPADLAFPEPIRVIRLDALATHTAGLPGNPPSVSLPRRLFTRHPFGRVTDTQAYASLAALGSDVQESTGYAYSNYGFMMLGNLLEVVTGSPYAQLIEQGIAAPLDMGNTWVRPPASRRHHLATGHRSGRTVEHWYDMPLPGASGVLSTVPDMLKYLDAHLVPDSSLLSRAIRLAMQPRVRASETVEVGLGWHVYTVPEAPQVVYHNGSTMGFRSYLGMAPELGLGIVVLGNSRDPTVGAIGRLLMRTLTGTND